VQDISNRLHNNLVIKASNKKVLSAATPNQSNRKVHPARDVDTFNALQSKRDMLHLRPQQISDQPMVSAETSTMDDTIIVRGTKEKKHILDAYKERFGQDFDHSIVSKKKGKIELDPNLNFPRMKPALDKWYRVSELLILNVITTVVKKHHLSSYSLKNLQLINKCISTMIPNVLRWLHANFSPLLEPHYNYEQQEHINTSQVKIASTAMIHFGLDPGKFVCFLGGEYTGYTHDVHRTLLAAKDHISPEILHT
jgi:hypothetical protein